MPNATNNKFLLELGDKIEFYYRLKPVQEGAKVIKIDPLQKLTLGQNQVLDGLDQRLIGLSSKDKKIELENFVMPADHPTLANQKVHLGLKIIKHQKGQPVVTKTLVHNVTANKNANQTSNKVAELEAKINQLEADKKLLESQKQKLEIELETNLVAFKMKQEQISQKAQEEISRIKHEIKDHAKTEIAENKKYILQKFLSDLLEPLNNLARTVNFGINQDNPQVSAYVKGFSLIVGQIFQLLNNYDVQIIEPQVGEEFNPEFHEAHELVSHNKLKKDQIAKVIDQGYKLHERVLKPAKVDVVK